eukprot:CAMPEP_0174370380 /NCGR_PEP_ID=MMETSP0811_2-20130205/95938_1 /TAXON_ID=73025 ORGANISM="Eutreptiella gymnastica-like, Strain CCMP1594" /NCGR_SAMPLE_ID=MMETSP0811_2 /ASSEMBLY_ACC=CAM_ASM_000667 /LENGTH=39 /DNA_ID= /DNA_START= /DNA_END= /DNA_ORIENTATION=
MASFASRAKVADAGATRALQGATDQAMAVKAKAVEVSTL